MNWHHCIHVHGDIASSRVWVHGIRKVLHGCERPAVLSKKVLHGCERPAVLSEKFCMGVRDPRYYPKSFVA